MIKREKITKGKKGVTREIKSAKERGVARQRQTEIQRQLHLTRVKKKKTSG